MVAKLVRRIPILYTPRSFSFALLLLGAYFDYHADLQHAASERLQVVYPVLNNEK